MTFNHKQAVRKRPRFSKDYGIDPNQQKGLLEWSWVQDRLENARNYWLATTRPGGKPHAAPLWGVFIRDSLYFGTHRGSQKYHNLSKNPAIVVHLESGDETVIIEGHVEVIEDRKLMAKIAAAYAAKYPGYNPSPDFDPTTVILSVHPETVFAWTENDFINTATTWQFK